MLKKSLSLALFLCLVLPGTAMAANIFGLEILDYGIYKTVGDANQDNSRLVAQAENLEKTLSIPAATGVEFGMEFIVRGVPKDSSISLTVRMIHPGITDPATGVETWATEWEIRPRLGQKSYVGWEFADDWEAAPGKWTLQLYNGSKMMAEKDFKVMAKVSDNTSDELIVGVEKKEAPEAAEPKVQEQAEPDTMAVKPEQEEQAQTAEPGQAQKSEEEPAPAPVPATKTNMHGKYFVQVGTFSVRANAAQFAKSAENAGYRPFFVHYSGNKHKNLTAVVLNSFATRPEADALAERYQAETGKKPFITTFSGKETIVDTSIDTQAPAPAAASALEKKEQAQAAPAKKAQPVKKPEPVVPMVYVVKVGEHDSSKQAQAQAGKMAGLGFAPRIIEIPAKGGATKYMVIMGWYPNKNDAQAAQNYFSRNLSGQVRVARVPKSSVN